MKIEECLEQMHEFTDDERAIWLKKMMARLCVVSHKSLAAFQRGWDGTRSFEDFKLAQCEVIKHCVELECTHMGHMVRLECGMKRLTMGDEL